MATSDDRVNFVPAHQGPNILPSHTLFSRLLRFAHQQPPRLCVRDDNAKTEATHIQLLSDVLVLRAKLWKTLGPSAQETLNRRGEVYIAVLAPGGYEYTVAMLAVLALGAAVVPMTVQLPPEEAVYFATQSRAEAILVASTATRLGVAVEKAIKERDPHSSFSCVPIQSSTFTSLLRPADIMISSDLYLDDSAPGVVIYTSGTTGPPKGAVMRRGYTFEGALAVADHYHITQADVLLHMLPVHHATGVGIMFFPFLVSGALIEFASPFSEAWTWDRWRRGGITFFSGVPTIYMRMRRYYETVLSKLPETEREGYVAGARALRVSLCGTSALPKPIADFWTEMFGGRKILLRYGATEIGAVFKVPLDAQDSVPDGSVGTLFAGCDVKLSTDPDTEGEIFVKSPEMFSKYLFDPQATGKAHTVDGYYRTGDIARKEGDFYFILGRASVDIIKSGGYKLSALDIEREILALPYVAEVMVVGVPDEEYGERVGAAIVMKNAVDMETPIGKLTIDGLRGDLRARLAGYKMPTLLRLVNEELPKSGTGKVVKKTLGPQFFPKDYQRQGKVQVWTKTAGKAKL